MCFFFLLFLNSSTFVTQHKAQKIKLNGNVVYTFFLMACLHTHTHTRTVKPGTDPTDLPLIIHTKVERVNTGNNNIQVLCWHIRRKIWKNSKNKCLKNGRTWLWKTALLFSKWHKTIRNNMVAGGNITPRPSFSINRTTFLTKLPTGSSSVTRFSFPF